MAAVLARYQKMIAAGQAAPVTTPTAAARPTRAMAPTGPALRPAPDTSPTPAAEDTLDAIRADLQAIVGRLDALARKGGQ